MERLVEIRNLLPPNLGEQLFDKTILEEEQKITFDGLEEIRLRMGQPLAIRYYGKEYLFWHIPVTKEDIRQALTYMSDYSLYAKQEDIRQGYLTVRGGHRIGVLGRAVMQDGQLVNQNYISFLNIRVAHQIIGCADAWMPFVFQNGELRHTLLVSPPGCGKTTLLRDMIRQISNGSVAAGKRVCVIDERSELAGCVEGTAQNDLGIRTDILDACPKALGMMMAVRAMTPEVIAVDEIGSQKDVEAIRYCMNCGCVMLGTVHAHDMEELKRKPLLQDLLGQGLFERILFLSVKSGKRECSCEEMR